MFRKWFFLFAQQLHLWNWHQGVIHWYVYRKVQKSPSLIATHHIHVLIMNIDIYATQKYMPWMPSLDSHVCSVTLKTWEWNIQSISIMMVCGKNNQKVSDFSRLSNLAKCMIIIYNLLLLSLSNAACSRNITMLPAMGDAPIILSYQSVAYLAWTSGSWSTPLSSGTTVSLVSQWQLLSLIIDS